MSIPLDEVLRTLRLFPAGATTKELARRLGMKQAGLASRLSKQFLYGGPVDRELGLRGKNVHAPSIWRAR